MIKKLSKRIQRDEQGSILLLSLVVLVVMSVVLVSMLGLNSSNFKATAAIQSQRKVVFDANGGIDTAVQSIRNTWAQGRDTSYSGDGIGADPCNFTMAGSVLNGNDATVTCTAQSESGKITKGNPANDSNTPPAAVITLSHSGVGFHHSKNTVLPVSGPVYSFSGISSNPSTINVTSGDVYAKGSCSGISVDTAHNYALHCNHSGANNIFDNPSSYTYATRSDSYTNSNLVDSTIPGNVQNPSAMTCSHNLGILGPGYYNNALALNDAMSLCSGGVWFKPGVYYFDFNDSFAMNLPNAPVIGGEANTNCWNPTAGPTFTPPSFPLPASCSTTSGLGSVPRRCKTDVDGVGPGVQFIFGNRSYMNVGTGDIELCAFRTRTEQQIAIYGLTSSTTSSASSTTKTPTSNTTPGAAGNDAFVNPVNTYAFDNATADYIKTVNDKASATGSISLANFDFSAIPAGSTINSATLRVKHQESNIASLTAKITAGEGSTNTIGSTTGATPASCATNTTQICIANSGGMTDQSAINLLPFLNDKQKISGMSLLLTSTTQAAPKNGSLTGTENIDGISISINYKPPTYRAIPVGTDLFTTASNGHDQISIHGSVYSPNSNIDITAKNGGGLGIDRGVIAYTFDSDVNPAAEFINGVSIPLTGSGGVTDPRVVTLRASVQGHDWVEARIKIYDYDTSTGTPVFKLGYKTEVMYWKVLR